MKCGDDPCKDQPLDKRGPYWYLAMFDPTPIREGAKFTKGQRDLVRQVNEIMNWGALKSDDSLDPYRSLVWPVAGETSVPKNRAEVDHIIPRASGGSNSLCNARVISNALNSAKGTSEE